MNYEYRTTDPTNDVDFLVVVSDQNLGNPMEFIIMSNGDVWVMVGVNAVNTALGDLYAKLPVDRSQHSRFIGKCRDDLDFDKIIADRDKHFEDYDILDYPGCN